MSENLKETAKPTRRRILTNYLLNIVGVTVFTICFFSPAREVMDVQLDASNYSSYSYFTAKDFQYGTEVMPMAGPYGFVPYGFMYSGHLFGKRLVLELVTKVVLGVLLMWFLRRAKRDLIFQGLWVAALFVMAPFIDDVPYSLAILLSGLCLIECHVAKDRMNLVISCALASYLALLTLFKGTQTTLAIATFGLLFLQAVFMRDFRRLPWIAATYVATLILLLIVAGQNPANLFHYLRGVLELSSGYNLAMGVDESRATFLTGASTIAALELSLLVLFWRRWHDPVLSAGILLLAGFSFIEWKHGFVRADGHVYIFFHFACLAAPTILLFGCHSKISSPRLWQRILATCIVTVAFGLAFFSDGWSALPRHRWSLTRLPGRIKANLHQLTHPAQVKAALEKELSLKRSIYQLSRIQEIVARSRIDFFGPQLGYLMLNQLDYRPRPMGGGPFNVFTPWLQDINTAFVSNPKTRPDYFLVEPLTIDDRLLTQDDPGTLRALLHFYRPEASELGVVLYKAISKDDSVLPTPKLLEKQTIVFGRPITPPAVKKDELLLISFSTPLNLKGRIRTSLYKPPMLFIDLEGGEITEPQNRRVIPSFFTKPVIFSPVLENNTDILKLYKGEEGKLVRRFSFHSPQPELFDTTHMEVSFYTVARPPAVPEIASAVIDSLGLPITTVPPLSIESINAPLRQFGALPVQILEPPGTIRFALTGEERDVSFIYGIDPKAYLEGDTDGVGFSVEIERPNQQPQEIFRSLLQPLTKLADRGSHTARVALPLFPRGSTIALKTDRGLTGNGNWDWAYFGGIRLHVRPYAKEQFPGFDRLPVNIDAANGGPLRYHDRDLFMLNSPGALFFALKASDRKLVFQAGLLPEAYTEGHTDGVQFTVDLRTPTGTTTRLFEAMVNPRDIPADRTDRTFSVDLPGELDPDAQLVLSALPGPANSTAWDWSYIAELHFEQAK